MATIAIFTPFSAEFPTSAFPALMQSNRRPVLAYDAATQETAYWTFVATEDITGTLTFRLTYAMATATSLLVDWEIQVEAISSGDAIDTDNVGATSFDTANSGSETVPAVAGYISTIAITLTNADSIAAGDYVRISVSRDADDVTNDTATGDAYYLIGELRDSA